MNNMIRFAVKLALLGLAAPALAYETSTHEKLTLEAIKRSVLFTNASFLTDLGLPAWDAAMYTRPQNSAIRYNAVETVKWGAVMEDDDYTVRAFNHFFDPQANNFQGRGLTYPPVWGNMSPDWILEDLGNKVDIYGGNCAMHVGCPQLYSFKRGQQQLYLALTAAHADERTAAAALMLKDIGHVVHHIQDMAQPQHTRNDQHTHPMPITGSNPQWSFYELFTKDVEDDIPQIVAANPYPKPVSFPTARQFWYSPNAGSAQFVGMAEFTSQNFTSYGAQFVGSKGDPGFIGAAPGLPLPNGSNKRIVNLLVPTVLGTDGQGHTGSAPYVMGPVYDGYTNTSRDMPLAAASIVSGVLGTKSVFVENTFLYEERYKVLFPRAVAFSTGLIEHFFRGRLDLSKGATIKDWTIKNTGTQEMEGTVLVYSEDGNGVRTPISGAQTYRTLAPGASAGMNFAVPAGTKKLIAAFRGRIGAEGNAQVPDWSAVAGKVVDYEEPEIVVAGWCRQPDYFYNDRGFVWSSRNGMRMMPLGAGSTGNEVSGISPDGKYVVGSSIGPVKWTGEYFTMQELIDSLAGRGTLPIRTVTNWLTVATAWDLRSGWGRGGAVYINAGNNYSVAWKTENNGKEIVGEAQLPDMRMVSVLWAPWGQVVLSPRGTYSRNLPQSADGSITLEWAGGTNPAVYVRNGQRFAIPTPQGFVGCSPQHVVIVP